MNLLGGLKSIFGFDGVGSTALRIVDRMAGTDWTPEQEAEFILKHAEVTKHQSPMRRFIAGTYTIAWLVLIAIWLSATVCGRMLESANSILLAGDISSFMSSNINLAMNGILAFYFLINMRK